MRKCVVVWGYPVVLFGFVGVSLTRIEGHTEYFFWSFMVGFTAAVGLLCLLFAIGVTFPKLGKRMGVSRNKKWDKDGTNGI